MSTQQWIEPSVVFLRMIGAGPVDCDYCGRTMRPQEWYVNVIRGASDPRAGANVCRACWDAHEPEYVP